MERKSAAAIALAIEAMARCGARISDDHLQAFLLVAEEWLPGLPKHTFKMRLRGAFAVELRIEMGLLLRQGSISELRDDDRTRTYLAPVPGRTALAPGAREIPDDTVSGFYTLGRWLGPKSPARMYALGMVELVWRERPGAHHSRVGRRMAALAPHVPRGDVARLLKELRAHELLLAGATAAPDPVRGGDTPLGAEAGA